MEKIFAQNGLLASHLDGYEARPGQEEMAVAVAGLIGSLDEVNNDQPSPATSLVIEAETGLGKTLAYLIPAVLSGRRVVVSTNTRNLQDQLIEREIPFIRKYIDQDFKAMAVKGRQNYLCLYRWHQFCAVGQGELFPDSLREKISLWLDKTRYGDRAELDWTGADSSIWQDICCQSHFCLGGDCPDAHHCFLNKLRRDAAACRLLVVNHHLFFSDLAVKQSGYGEVLPRYEVVIFDEAHHVENVAGHFFGRSLSRYQVRELAADIERSCLAGQGRQKNKELISMSQAISGRMGQLMALFPAKQGRFPLAMDNNSPLSEGRDKLAMALTKLAEALDNMGGTSEPWQQFSGRCRDILKRLEFILAEKFNDLPVEEELHIYWFERREKNLIISATPVDIGKDLQETLFADALACVFTSATLTSNGEFSYFLKRTGLSDDTISLSFSSPFPYREHSLIYIPGDDFPQPSAAGYQKKLHEQMKELVSLSRGRALVLFTSFAALDAAWHVLRDELDYPIFRQGEMPRHVMLKKFINQTEAVLFAVASFWEGVDVPGESLSMVIIDKLPFEVPTDPVIMARMGRIKNEGGNPFFDFQVPQAILTLRQGAGRLMRRASDRGVIAILDIRLFSKGYGKRFLRSLPPSPVVRELEKVENFFAHNGEGK
jgi:ATP-dependent DNA helicase DinG